MSGDGQLNVTIAWNDPPHDPFGPSVVLFDISVSIKNGKGDELASDHNPFNTVKTTSIGVTADQEVMIDVRASSLCMYNSVNYSLVVTGPFPEDQLVFDSEQEILQASTPPNVCALEDGVAHNAVSKPYAIEYFEYQFEKWRPGESLDIRVVSKPETSLLVLWSLGELPTLRKAHCTSDKCDWATMDQDTITLPYLLWDFIEDETLYVGLYSKSLVNYSITVQRQRNTN